MAFEKAPKDPRGQHMRFYMSIYDSNAWQCLGTTDQRVYMAIFRQMGSTNNGDLSLPFSVAKRHGIKSQTTLASSLRALCAVGLVAVTRKGGATRGGQRLATLFRLTHRECLERPAKYIPYIKATDDWKLVATLAQGRARIKAADDAARQKAVEEKTQLQKLGATASKNGVNMRLN